MTNDSNISDRSSWIMKVLYDEDITLNVLAAGPLNWLLAIPKDAPVRFGRVRCTISATVGANLMRNRRTLFFGMQLGWMFMNPNHSYDAAVKHDVVTPLSFKQGPQDGNKGNDS